MIDRPIKVADECWLALALLTREHAERNSFSSGEILDRIRKERIHPQVRPGVTAHIHQHIVANRPPSTARYRMTYRLPDGTFRLYRPGDDCHEERSGKTRPDRDDVPVAYHELIDWYEEKFGTSPTGVEPEQDPILSLRGLGKEIWKDVDADAWVNELRSGWDTGSAVSPEPSQSTGIRRSHDDASQIWKRIVENQRSEFRTSRNHPFTYQVEGDSGIWFFRSGRRVERRLWRGEVEAALNQTPPRKPSDLSRFQCPSYLFALLTDPRISGGRGRA